jgi:hypothetical protein
VYQRAQCLAQRVATQAKLGDQLALGRDALADRPFTGRDQLLELVRDLRGQGGGTGGGD